MYGTDRTMHWKGKAHWFLPCLKENGAIWAAEYPVVFHRYKDPHTLLQVHAMLIPPATDRCAPIPPP